MLLVLVLFLLATGSRGVLLLKVGIAFKWYCMWSSRFALSIKLLFCFLSTTHIAAIANYTLGHLRRMPLLLHGPLLD